MAQIVTEKAISTRCNLIAIRAGGSKENTVLAEGEIWLVDTTNASKIHGYGRYDSYIVGDGTTVAKNLTVNEIDDLTALSNRINTEVSTRADMDDNLQDAIDAEADARQAADNLSHTELTAEATSRQSADTALQTAIQDETAARIAADALKVNKSDVQDISTVADAMVSTTNPISAHSLGVMKAYVDADKASKSYVNGRLDTQDQKINLLDGHEVVVVPDHTAVTNPDPQKIYREPGDDSYTDWMYQGSTWHEMAEYPVPLGTDAIFDENLNKTQEEVNELAAGVFDISVANAVGGTPTTYSDLSEALGTNGANVPQGFRKGGMPVKFIQTSDNKYVEYFLPKDEWSVDEADWEKMNLEEEVSLLGQELNGGNVSFDLSVGFYKNDLTIDPASAFRKAIIAISPHWKEIAINASVRANAYISLTDINDQILWQTNNGTTRTIDLSNYPTAAKLYLSNEVSVVANPSVYVYGILPQMMEDINTLQQATEGLTNNVTQLDDVINGSAEETTTQYSEVGYIKYADGSIVTGNSWIHTPLLPIGNIVKFGKFVRNASVANIAFYATNDLSSYISGLQAGTDVSADSDLLMSSITPPPNANYIAFSTNAANYPSINVVTQEDTDGLVDTMDGINAIVNGTTETEQTDTQYSNPGYIALDGSIVTGNTWIHTDLIPFEDFISVVKLISHASVAVVACYSSNSYNSFLDSISRSTLPVPNDGVITKADFSSLVPQNTKFVAFSTNAASATLTVTAQRTIVTEGLTGKIATLEELTDNLNTRVTTIEHEVNGSTKKLHFSFDDTISAFYDVAHNNRASIFDNAFFGALKTLHETYGAVFSCYCFLDYFKINYVTKISTITNPDTSAVYKLVAQDGEFAPGLYVYTNGNWTDFSNVTRSDYVIFSLSEFPSTHAAEFAVNASWLKFGLHGRDGMTNYATATAEEASADYNSFITSILAITGTPESVDTVVRLQNFLGTIDVCRALRDADLGVQGFLCTDYSETSGGSGGVSGGYYITSALSEAIWKKGQIYDYAERLHFYVSGLRMDSISSANMPSYLTKFYTAQKWEQTAMVEMYCHENQMYRVSDNTITSDYIARIQAVCSWAVAKKFNFAYQMDRIRQSF